MLSRLFEDAEDAAEVTPITVRAIGDDSNFRYLTGVSVGVDGTV